jgi:protein-histidine N-methyltransferase
MSFGFQFDEEDLDDEYKADVGAVKEEPKVQGEKEAGPSTPKKRVQAKKHTLQELIAALPPRVSYSSLIVPTDNSNVTIIRRDLFDARFQLINDDNDGSDDDNMTQKKGSFEGLEAKKMTEWETYSAGADTDLVPGVYEGGFKTWECSVDLTIKLHQQLCEEEDGGSSWLRDRRITDLGCGTAIPSLYLFYRLLSADTSSKWNCTFELCDFNDQVLRLVCVTSVFGWLPHRV